LFSFINLGKTQTGGALLHCLTDDFKGVGPSMHVN